MNDFEKLLNENKELLEAVRKVSRAKGDDLENLARCIRPDGFLELVDLIREKIGYVKVAIYESPKDCRAPEDYYSNQGSARYSLRVFSGEPQISGNGHPDWCLNYKIAIIQCDGAGDVLEEKIKEKSELIRIVKTPKKEPEEVRIYRYN